jgi:hypothetical protein
MKKYLLLLGVLSLAFSAGNIIYLQFFQGGKFKKLKFHGTFNDKKGICKLPHRVIRK